MKSVFPHLEVFFAFKGENKSQNYGVFIRPTAFFSDACVAFFGLSTKLCSVLLAASCFLYLWHRWVNGALESSPSWPLVRGICCRGTAVESLYQPDIIRRGTAKDSWWSVVIILSQEYRREQMSPSRWAHS